MKYIRSPMNYIGGKYKVLDSIIPVFPKQINSFVDLFMGSMNVGINTDANTIYINDRVSYLIDVYRYFRDTDIYDIIHIIHDRIEEFCLTPCNVASFNKFRSYYNNTRNPIDLFILTCYSFNHNIRFNSKHQFNVSVGMRSYNDSIQSNLIMFCEELRKKNIVFSSCDFREFDFSVLNSGDLVYCDPPYLITSASYNDGNRGFGGWSSKDDIELYELLDNLDAKGILFALSNVVEHRGTQNDCLEDWSNKYKTTYINKQYADCSYNVKNRYGKSNEVLITNFYPNTEFIDGRLF